MKIAEILDQSDKNEIESYLSDHGYDNDDDYNIDDDGSVTFFYDCHLTDVKEQFPFKLGDVYNSQAKTKGGTCNIEFGDGYSPVLEKFIPKSCSWLTLESSSISTLKGFKCPAGCYNYKFDLPKLVDLHNIHKYIGDAQYISFSGRLEKNVLGLLLIKNLTSITYNHATYDNDAASVELKRFEDKYIDDATGEVVDPSEAAIIVVASHLGLPNGIVKAQRRLIELDLDDFAGH